MTLSKWPEKSPGRLANPSCATPRTAAGLRRTAKFQADRHWRDLSSSINTLRDNGRGRRQSPDGVDWFDRGPSEPVWRIGRKTWRRSLGE